MSFDLAEWATLVGTWVLVVGTMAFAYWQLRQAQRLHSATTLLDLRERFYSARMRQARRDLALWLLGGQRETETENWEAGVFFELMGHLTRTGVLEKRMVWSAFGSWVTSYYTMLTQPVNRIAEWRKEGNDPLVLAEFEWLAQQLMAYEGKLVRNPQSGMLSLEEARDILENESRLPLGDAPAPLTIRGDTV